MSMAMVPKIDKNTNVGQYARTKANIMQPKHRKTPNITEDLSNMSNEIKHFRTPTDLGSRK